MELSVETNLKVVKAPRHNGIPISELVYYFVREMAVKLQGERTDSRVFAHINRASEVSFRMFGLKTESIATRDDLRTPSDKPGEFDPRYRPVALSTKDTEPVLGKLAAIAPNQMTL